MNLIYGIINEKGITEPISKSLNTAIRYANFNGFDSITVTDLKYKNSNILLNLKGRED